MINRDTIDTEDHEEMVSYDDDEFYEECRACYGTGMDKDEVFECESCGGDGVWYNWQRNNFNFTLDITA